MIINEPERVNLRSLRKRRKNNIEGFIIRHQLQRIHLSIDIDVVDPAEAPGTGVPELNGISSSSLKEIVKYLIDNYNVCTVDLVEFLPGLDKGGKTGKILFELGKTIVESI